MEPSQLAFGEEEFLLYMLIWVLVPQCCHLIHFSSRPRLRHHSGAAVGGGGGHGTMGGSRQDMPGGQRPQCKAEKSLLSEESVY